MKPQIIHEDEMLLVLNKPAGLVVHSDGRTQEQTLVDWLLDVYPSIRGVGESWETPQGDVIERPGIVHRLDRDTSGVMVVAKTQGAYEHLKAQFQERQVQKEYHALVLGAFKPEKEEGTIDKPIGKSPSDFRKWSAQPGARGTLREAVTEYEVLSQVGVGNDGYAYVAARPQTGRTHQIRVHFKAIHHPILGDTLYGSKKTPNIGTKIPRTMLHAHKLAFTHTGGEQVSYTADIPEDFMSVLQKLDLGATSV